MNFSYIGPTRYRKYNNMQNRKKILNIQSQKNRLKVQNTFFNILIRNTYRPNHYKTCIDSVLNQSHQNFKIWICYDDDNCLDYLNYYKGHPQIEIFKTSEVDKSQTAFYNLYVNELLDKVEHGWILFLDDDDMYANSNSLKIIANNLSSVNDIIFWKVKMADIIIYPRDINNIENVRLCEDGCYKGHISTIGFCFNAKFKNLERWSAGRNGDHRFVFSLLKKHPFVRKFINEILSKIQHNDIMGLFGKKELKK
jgi:hypothetical protein